MAQRVLVVDDSAVVRLSVVRRVRAEGCDVVEADSKQTGSAVDATTLACALLDLDLGDGFGTDVADALRHGNAELPIAFFTSETSGDAVDRAKAIGPVFAKPAEMDAAIAWVVSSSRSVSNRS